MEYLKSCRTAVRLVVLPWHVLLLQVLSPTCSKFRAWCGCWERSILSQTVICKSILVIFLFLWWLLWLICTSAHLKHFILLKNVAAFSLMIITSNSNSLEKYCDNLELSFKIKTCSHLSLLILISQVPRLKICYDSFYCQIFL